MHEQQLLKEISSHAAQLLPLHCAAKVETWGAWPTIQKTDLDITQSQAPTVQDTFQPISASPAVLT